MVWEKLMQHSVGQRRTLSNTATVLLEDALSAQLSTREHSVGQATLPHRGTMQHSVGHLFALFPPDIQQAATRDAATNGGSPMDAIIDVVRQAWNLSPPDDEWRN